MLLDRVAHDCDAAVAPEVAQAAACLGAEAGAVAVLFYGSVLRSGQLDDVLDFYVLTDRQQGSVVRRTVSAVLWPDVAWRELPVGGRVIRAKVATMPATMFERAAHGDLLDTTIWARFAQPVAVVWARDASARRRAVAAVAAAIVTAGRFAAALGPVAGTARDYWLALFARTYRAEFRVETVDRSAHVLDHAPARYDSLLPLAWNAAGIGFEREGDVLQPRISDAERRRLTAVWRRRARAGKPLNIARLVKAAFTFDGATRYALYKIERHTGVAVALTPWRERHPVLAAPGVLWRVFRARRG